MRLLFNRAIGEKDNLIAQVIYRQFLRCFDNKRDLPELYNALNGTTYDDTTELKITTLNDCIYLTYKNDLSFIISATLNLYEHQSTYNPNMPIRGLIYFARIYEAYIKEHCEKYDILKDILGKQRSEVFNLLLNESDVKIYERGLKTEGKAEGKAEDIIELLEDVGEVSDSLRYLIMPQTDLTVLSRWHKLAARTPSVEAFEKAIEVERI